ncbi:MAG: multiheme c-type cytochrome [Desulfuromonadales bacterium]|nr:multiheme c-type cytochrome [Desulfuromonadales bacterium]MDW7757145.1 multiheme c-type cytochrome [Desulfuromonadales bacterium]
MRIAVCLLMGLVTFLLVSISAAAVTKPEEATVCLQCHGAQDGRLGQPVPQWRQSIHAEQGISCHHCHGGDPTDAPMAMSPERGFVGVPAPAQVADFCGRCHIGVLEDYLASAHGKAPGGAGPQCVTCHAAHPVKKASLDLINPQACGQCHGYERADEIRSALAATDHEIAELEKELDLLQGQGVAIDTLQKSLFSLRNEYHRLFHSVDLLKIKAETEKFRESLREMRQQVDAILDELAGRKVYGAIVVGFFVLAGFVLLLIRKTYEEEE